MAQTSPRVSGRYSTEARTMPETVAIPSRACFPGEARLTAYLNDAQNGPDRHPER